MTAMPEEPSPVRGDLREAYAALDVMPGFRAELVDGEIIVSPTPDGQHETIVVAVDDWVRDVHGLRLHRNLTLISPEGEYVPDGIAAPRALSPEGNGTVNPMAWRWSWRLPLAVRAITKAPNATAGRSAAATPPPTSRCTC